VPRSVAAVSRAARRSTEFYGTEFYGTEFYSAEFHSAESHNTLIAVARQR
jgi:hypothetical protein